jgi:hypothetical protein
MEATDSAPDSIDSVTEATESASDSIDSVREATDSTSDPIDSAWEAADSVTEAIDSTPDFGHFAPDPPPGVSNFGTGRFPTREQQPRAVAARHTAGAEH